jgi:hypothetical protein
MVLQLPQPITMLHQASPVSLPAQTALRSRVTVTASGRTALQVGLAFSCTEHHKRDYK